MVDRPHIYGIRLLTFVFYIATIERNGKHVLFEQTGLPAACFLTKPTVEVTRRPSVLVTALPSTRTVLS